MIMPMASSPLMPGMRRSMSTRSGINSRVLAMPGRPSLASPTTSNSGVVQGFAYDGHGVELALEGQAARCAGLLDLRRDALHLAKLSHVALHPDAKRFSRLRSGVQIEDGVSVPRSRPAWP